MRCFEERRRKLLERACCGLKRAESNMKIGRSSGCSGLRRRFGLCSRKMPFCGLGGWMYSIVRYGRDKYSRR